MASDSQTYDIMIAGSDLDPNIVRLLSRGSELGYHICPCLYGKTGTPRIEIDVGTEQIHLNREPVATRSVFVRQDVFRYLETQRAADWQRAREWFALIFGWATARTDVRFLNWTYFNRPRVNKLAMLMLAQRHGIPVTQTRFTTDLPALQSMTDPENWICKPVEGGEHTRSLSDFLANVADRPAYSRPITVQRRLTGREIRVFRVGEEIMSFDVRSESLDYREHQDADVRPANTPDEIAGPFKRFTDSIGLDFCAGDFLEDQNDGRLHMLEINTGPMFVHFDYVMDGELTRALLAALTQR
jgi:glutathione synthase/RimK-type ligase-like ATP-grasp enzyme